MRNIPAEMAIIGTLLKDAKNSIPKLIEMINPDKFSDFHLAKAYTIALDMFSRYGRIDEIPLIRQLCEDKQYTENECKILIANCVATGSLEGLQSYIDEVSNCYKQRQLKDLCESILFQNGNETADIMLARAGQRIGELQRDSKGKGLQPLSSIVLEEYRKLYNSDELKDRVYTGFTAFDEKTQGFTKKNLVIVAARPGVGKSALALNFAISIAKTGKKVAFYSLEMGISEQYERIIANAGNINMGMIKDRKFDNNMSKRINSANVSISDLPISLCDDGTKTVQDIRTEVQVSKIDVLIVDYLQLIESVGKSDTRNNEISKITRQLKQMAQDLDIVVIALSQLNRDKSEMDEPTLSDLRDSGAIEQDANVVLLMWRNNESKDDDISCNIALRCAKNRGGKRGETVLCYTGAVMKFEETDHEVNHIKKTSSWRKENA